MKYLMSKSVESNHDFWTSSSLPDDTDDFPEAVCPICGETTCDHYDDYEPLFKSCQTIGG